MTYVPPDGPIPAEIAVVGEGPAREEIREGRGFVGPSGSLLWPLAWSLAGITRAECYVTNLSKTPLDNSRSGDAKMSEEEFLRCQAELHEELGRVEPKRVLAVGALAAKALLGEDFTTMQACNGIGFAHGDRVIVPTWHPAAALYGGQEDTLAWTAAAIRNLREPPIHPNPPEVPKPEVYRAGETVVRNGSVLGVDTEGTPDKPLCMTVATKERRLYVPAANVPMFFQRLFFQRQWSYRPLRLVFHNALWDWSVLKAMGAPGPDTYEWCDTMEMAYLRHTEPRGLKDLAWRHLGLRMKSFEETARPGWEAAVRQEATYRIDADSVTRTYSEKTGRLLKKPKVTYGPRAKVLRRRMRNADSLAETLGFGSLSLEYTPFDEVVEYATLDAWATLMVKERLT